MCADQIDRRPRAEAEYIYAVRNRQLNLFDMLIEEFNTIWIVYHVAFLQFVKCTQTVFCNNQWQVITGIDLAQGSAEAHGINFPAKLCFLQVGIHRSSVCARFTYDFMLVSCMGEVITIVQAFTYRLGSIVVKRNKVRVSLQSGCPYLRLQ